MRSSVQGKDQFDALATRVAGAFVRVTTDKIDAEINLWLKRILLILGLDRSTIAEIDPVSGSARFTHGWARHRDLIIRQPLDANELLPWTIRKMLAGETIVMSNPESLPRGADIDRESFRQYGTRSSVMIPIKTGSTVIGGVSFASLYRERTWAPRIVRGLRTVAEMLGYALERKRTTAETLRLRSELAYLSRVTTMGQLVASIAHELNQPLTAILSNAEAIQNILATNRPALDEVRAGIADIIEDGNRAGAIIRDLRGLFQRNDVAKSKINLAELLGEIDRIVRGDALIRGISFIMDLQPKFPPILGQRVQLQEALINLISNAFDAVTGVTEGPREVRVTAQADAEATIISVRDSGNGISPELLPRIFDAFFTTKTDGTGMGLGIARSIIEAHAGKLSALPNSNNGMTFEIRLPISANTAP